MQNSLQELATAARVSTILAQAKMLAIEYYQLTGKPLGITGEVGEHLVANLLGLELAPARTSGYDAVRRIENQCIKVQIKSRARPKGGSRSQRIGKIKLNADCDVVVLALLDSDTLEIAEVWEAPYTDVVSRLLVPGSKARDRGSLSVSEFLKIALCVWPLPAAATIPVSKLEHKQCPECGYAFRSGTWGGIDAHWRSAHAQIAPYEEVRSSILSGLYQRKA